MSSNPHNSKLIDMYSAMAKKIVHSSNNINGKPINNLRIKSNKNIAQNNQTLDNFLTLFNSNNPTRKSNSIKNINSNTYNNGNSNKSKSKNINIKNSNEDFLNKKRKFKSKEEEEYFKKEMEASKEIDRMLEEIRKEKKNKILEKQKEKDKDNNNESNIAENKKSKKKNNIPVNKKNFYLEALGLTEEGIEKENQEKEKNDKAHKDHLNTKLGNSDLKINYNNNNSIISLSKKNKEKIPKYYDYKVSREEIYKKVLSFEFYKEKLKTEIIPDYFENELHYRYIWMN